MTDTSSVAITHSTTESFPVAVPLNSPALNGAISDSVAPEEEEPYTIKCICAFEDDDGNTVFCEGCETWQHIECYYPGRGVPEVHNCVDCEPRYLDGKRATERQRRLREQSDGGDRKAKRSGSKTQRKKKDDHANGFHHRSESSARDLPPAKKAKGNHRSTGSVSSLSGTPALSSDVRKRAGSAANALSSTKPPGPFIPLYSNEFLHLYERDRGHADMDSNLFVNLPLAADLASWVTDPTALSRVSNGRSAQDIFTWSAAALDRSRWPILSTESITDSTIDIDGKYPTWKILKTRDHVRKDEIVGEIKGKIGLLRDYCLDPNNRWQELRHPEPFVFFHPQLPIYIDSRHEGSMLRYVRRSCRPNVTMKTYITNEVEYHFCFVAKDDIPADSELTAMWYLDPQLFESSNGLVKQESSDSAQEVAAICISNVLSHFGGCACHPPQNCLLSSVDRRRHPKAIDSSSKQVNGKRKKTKSKPTVSPLGTGRASNSRAGSEATRNLEDDDQADSRSTSGSVRGPTRSRDLTPTMQNYSETSPVGESGLSARDMRKLAAVEKKFQQLEQDQHAPQKKKKRTSGQSAQATPTAATSTQTGYFGNPAAKAVQSDMSFRRQSGSPPSALSVGSLSAARKTSGSSTPTTRSPLAPQYVDRASQTDINEDDLQPTTPTTSRPSFVPLTQRLLKRCHEDRIKLDKMSCQRSLSIASQPDGTSLTSPVSMRGELPQNAPSKGNSSEIEDVEMKDADLAVGATTPSQSLASDVGDAPNELAPVSPTARDGATKPLFPPPWPSTLAHNSRIPAKTASGNRTDLRLPLPSPSTAFSPNFTSPSTAQSPSLDPSSTQASSQVLGSNIAAPSPVKKKLSLGDYISRRGTLATPTSEKSQAQTTARLPLSHPQENRNATSPAEDSHNHPQLGIDANSAKVENPSAPDVPMKDMPEPTHSPHVPSVSS